MHTAVPLVEIWRGDVLESMHYGHAVICDAQGQVVEAWGDPNKVILPRSSCKMVQALPLIESGAARAFGLTTEQLALSCASHNGAAIHTDRVGAWLGNLGLSDQDFRCGPQLPDDRPAREALIKADQSPCQIHNNCSGKHAGFLTLAKHLGAGPEYINPDHPVQRASKAAFEEVTGEDSLTHAIDGCSAPNFATTVTGLARAMARFAAPESGARGEAMQSLFHAMLTHPDLVAGEGRACTELMRAMEGRVAVKTGAEGVFAAILPEQGLGIALKIDDGATRASECAMASILVRLGALNPDHPMTLKRRNVPVKNRRGVITGYVHPSHTGYVHPSQALM
jgi:L-asparaginase II